MKTSTLPTKWLRQKGSEDCDCRYEKPHGSTRFRCVNSWYCIDKDEHCEFHDLGEVPEDITEFNSFYEARRDRLLDKLGKILGTPMGNGGQE